MNRSSVKDMTEGSPLKLILQFSVPMLIGNLFQQFYNMVDSIVVGRFVGKEALAAVGTTGPLLYFIQGLAFGLSGGIAVVIAQYFGAKDYERVKKAFATSAYLVIIITVLFSGIGVMSCRWLLELIMSASEVLGRVLFANILVNYISYYGIWWATGLTWVLAASVGTVRYLSGKWKTKAIVNA